MGTIELNARSIKLAKQIAELYEKNPNDPQIKKLTEDKAKVDAEIKQGLSGGIKPELDRGLKVEKGTSHKSSKHKTGHAVDVEEPLPGVKEFHEDMNAAFKACAGENPDNAVRCLNAEVSRRQRLREESKPKSE